MEILIIVIIYVIYKLFSLSDESKKLENIGDISPSLGVTYENSNNVKKTNNKNSKLEKNGNTKVLSIENLTEWLENPSPNRSFYSLSLVFNIIMLDEPNITVVSNKIFKTLEDKKINTSVETIYENIIRLWNDASLNTEYIKLNNNNFIHSTELQDKNLKVIEKMFTNAINNQANYIFNKKKIVSDLNYLFEIITKNSTGEFL